MQSLGRARCLGRSSATAECLFCQAGDFDAHCRHRQSVRLDAHWLGLEDVTTLFFFHAQAYLGIHVWSFHGPLTALEGRLALYLYLYLFSCAVLHWATHLHSPDKLRLLPVRFSPDPFFCPDFLCFPPSVARQNGGERT